MVIKVQLAALLIIDPKDVQLIAAVFSTIKCPSATAVEDA
jgi:hypothetical protein